MILEWLPAALHDFDALIDYIAEENPTAAIAQGDTIEARISELPAHPRRGRPGRVSGTRELVITTTPFIVVYRITKTRIQILRILHGAQPWPPVG